MSFAKPENLLDLQQDFVQLKEGKAVITLQKGKVFYNPVQEFNRDISIAVLNAYSHDKQNPIRILECLSATGLRSIRYGLEVNNVSKVIANDVDPFAVALINQNIIFNNLSEKIFANSDDAK